jgi:hypothetical protein
MTDDKRQDSPTQWPPSIISHGILRTPLSMMSSVTWRWPPPREGFPHRTAMETCENIASGYPTARIGCLWEW